MHFAIDGLDWKTQAPQREQPGYVEQQGAKFILCMIDRATRKFFARPLKTRAAGETRDAVLSMLREAEATETIKEMSMDSASEFLSAEMRNELRKLGPNAGGISTHMKPPNRESRQDIADLDSKMGIFSRAWANIRRKVRP